VPALPELSRLLRFWSLQATSTAGSGHPSSALSAADLMAGLFFGGHFRFLVDNPRHPNNDRLIFSKGHAAPLLYALWAAAGAVAPSELLRLRQKDNPLEGHPTMAFPFAEAATGSLGQGLAIGLGMALNAKYLDGLPYRTYVLLGDSELSEGSNWESIQLAAHYQLNRLGQRGETMLGHDTGAYERRLQAFGWNTIVIDGHDFPQIDQAFRQAGQSSGRPTMIIAKTFKGKGLALLENRDGWHGKALTANELAPVMGELGPVDESWRGELARPEDLIPAAAEPQPLPPLSIDPSRPLAPRQAYGSALVRLGKSLPNLVVLDAEVSNSTFADRFAQEFPDRFFEMFIAEQNMVGTALGLAARGKLPFVSTFGAFFTRASDQLRMAAYSLADVKFCGGHVGVSIGADGVSQMGLEDIALFRSLFGCAVLYPADGAAMEKLVETAAEQPGMVYLRSTRMELPVLYGPDEKFPLGGSKTLRRGGADQATVIAAGVTLHEALAAADHLAQAGTSIRVIDLYSVKPLDLNVLRQAVAETSALIVVEDHYPEGGIGEAVRGALGSSPVRFKHLAVRNLPHSGTPAENLASAGIDSAAIERAVQELVTMKR
jgi:transketolase